MLSRTLKHRVRIERQSDTYDEIGQKTNDWELVDDTWANIKHPTGYSAIKSGSDTSIVQASIRIRTNPAIDAGMRVVHKDSIYDIQAVLPDERGRFVDLLCKMRI
ncbi:phage head closure protein [Azonexus sp. IMCC34839]|uniref:phage head closure protein n=1 Tax=Azonexus sp. IMCC34839 TaxID=3133695 RepID=UPI00399AEE91